MIEMKKNSTKAVIILHEIYGINRFIQDICTQYHAQGFDVFCPNMMERESFDYVDEQMAYDYFGKQVGFQYSMVVEQLLERLKLTYEKVFLIGFSVGGTIAWRCCENSECDGIICYYGSRIRDYLTLQPSCPVLLLFAEQDFFDVDGVVNQLIKLPKVDICRFQASHGFMDSYSGRFNEKQSERAKMYSEIFLKSYS